MASTEVEQLLDAAGEKIGGQMKSLLEERDAKALEEKTAQDQKIADLEAKLAKLQDQKGEHAKRTSLPGVEYDKDGTKPGEAYSIARAVALAGAQLRPHSELGQVLNDKAYGYELEVQKHFKEARKRTFNVGTDEAGGIFVPHEVLTDSIIPQLEAQSVVRRAGATSIGGLRGNLTWPVEEGGFMAYYVDTEGEELITESVETFSSKSASPHTLAAKQRMSHKQMLQASIEPWIRRRFAVRFALREDLTAIEGSGSASVPLGFRNAPTLQTVDWGTPTYGGASDTTQDSLIAHIYALRNENAFDPAGRFAWIADPKAIQRLSQVKDADGRRMYRDGAAPLDSLMGYPVFETTQPATSATDAFFAFGDFSKLLLLTWGGLTIRATESGDDAERLRMTIIGHMDHDVLVEQPKAFSIASNLDQAA